MPQEYLGNLTRAGDDEQEELLPSDLCTAASGRQPQTPAAVSAPWEASIPFRTELTEP